MLVTYDSQADALYMYLQHGRDVAKSVVVDDERAVDIDEVGGVIGIEILSASAGFELVDIIKKFNLEARAEEILQAAKEFRPAAAV